MNEPLSKKIFRYLLSFFFIGVGLYHFLSPAFFVAIVPSYLPSPLALVYISGVFEILGGIGVLIPATKKWAGYGLIALLFSVFPANIHMAINNVQIEGFDAPRWALWLRLPVQFVFIYWVYWCTIKNSKSLAEEKA